MAHNLHATSHHANRLLAALDPEIYAKFEPHLHFVELPAGRVISEAGSRVETIYFPHDSVVSLVAEMCDGGTAEMATIGREGVLDAVSWRNSGTAMARNIVQIAGSASGIRHDALAQIYRACPGLHTLLNHYLEAFLAQALQMVACNAVHTVETRACRWILMTHDRVEKSNFRLTHELLAQMLGVQRPTVSVVARTLQTARLIRQERASITVIDRKGLEESACECYGIIRDNFNRYLPGSFPH